MKFDKDMKEYAKVFRVPISLDDTISFVCETIRKHDSKQILEIGTAIGYSAILMAQNTDLNHIDTLEIDKERYNEALKNIEKSGLNNKISAYLTDAKIYLENCTKKYDLVYLDGPKGQYINYLPYILNLLNDGGVIIADNLFFHGMVTGEIPISKGCRAMIKGLKKYIDEICNNPQLDSKILNIGDGVGISIFQKNK